jgi:hypothetical protein
VATVVSINKKLLRKNVIFATGTIKNELWVTMQQETLSTLSIMWAVPWLKQLIAGRSTRSPGFAPRSLHVVFVVDKEAMGRVVL